MTRPIENPPAVALPRLLEVVTEALFTEFREDLVEAGYGDIRPGHGCVFRFITDEGGMRLTELAGLAGMTKQSIGEAVDGLVELGYVERIPDPEDRRAKLIRLTDRGKVAQGIGFSLFAKLEDRWAERYGPDRMADLRNLLEEIATTQVPDAVPELAGPELASA
jgi:DNA-binding MarR family transcriptional regulator